MDGPSGALRDPGCATPASDCRRLHRTGSNVPTAAEALVLGPGARARQRDEEQVERRARGQAASMRLALLTVLPDAGDAARHDEMADSTRRERASQQSSFFATRRPSSRASSSQRDRPAHARLVNGARRGASTARLMQLALGAGDGHRRPRLVGGRHDRAEKARDHRSDHGGPRGGHAGPRGLETGPLYSATLTRHPRLAPRRDSPPRAQGVSVKMYRYTYDQNLLLRPSEGLTNYRQGEQRAADRGVRAADRGCNSSGHGG